MKKKFKKFSVVMLLVSVLCTSLFAAPYYDNGSQRFTITAGPTLPLTLTGFGEDKTYVGSGVGSEGHTGLDPVGGFGSIAYQVFVNSYIALGGEIGYGFNFVVNDALLTNVPMQFKMTFLPVQGTFEIPLSLGLGISYMSYSYGGAYLPFFLSFETGFDWYFTEHWGVGLKSGIWVIPELYFQKNRADQNSLMTMIPITLSFTYRQ